VYKLWFALAVLFLSCSVAQANNIVIHEGPYFRKIEGADHGEITFGLMWENSWKFKHKNRHNVINWDAAWVFAKYSVNKGSWKHVYLDDNAASHRIIEANDSVVMSMGISPVNGTDRVMGVFLYRDTISWGTIEFNKVSLRWNYKEFGITNEDTLDLRLFAIEMVYIPEGVYSFGDGAGPAVTDVRNRYVSLYNSNGNLIDGPCSQLQNIPIESEDVSLRFRGTAIPAAYPRGFKGIYCMKHEISQHAYVDFLNTLTIPQQTTRTWSAPTAAMNTFAVGPNAGTTATTFRNFIRIRIPASVALNTPAMYGHSVSGGTTSWDRDSNGGNIACNFLNIFDGLAYADWAGLRPMTEMEFEKICRGPIAHFTGEYAWGARFPDNARLMIHNNTGREFAFGNFQPIGGAPYYVMRVGAFARSQSTREESGAAYYGVMNMSDNVWERVISLKDGLDFNGQHGDGELDENGYANTPTWPMLTNFKGWGTRGNQTSNRTHAETLAPETTNTAAALRAAALSAYGFRAVRTAP
jgi:hypothetical protein